jgi:hypothetical protein
MITYGYELELSDTHRAIDIPSHLGRWEGPKIGDFYMGAEIDIVNTLPPYNGIGSDPLCQTTPVGGEINVCPSSFESQFLKVFDIINLFPKIGHGHVNHFHLHTYTEEFNDVEYLKRLVKYTIANQHDLVNATYLQNWDDIEFNCTDWGRSYLLQDGGRYLNAEINAYIDDVKTIDDIKELLKKPSWYIDNNEVQISTSIRTAVNLSNLINNKTLEFRCFRSTLCYHEIISQMMLVKRYLESVNDSTPVTQLLTEYNYKFAPLIYIESNQKGWEKTRHDKERGAPYKYYYDSGMAIDESCSEHGRFAYTKAMQLLGAIQ